MTVHIPLGLVICVLITVLVRRLFYKPVDRLWYDYLGSMFFAVVFWSIIQGVGS